MAGSRFFGVRKFLSPLHKRFLSSGEQLWSRGQDLQPNIRYYQLSYVDLFGVQRSKLVPASAMRDLGDGGVGFGGFASHLDMTPADGDLIAIPDPDTFTVLPWQPEVAWLACDLELNDEPVEQSPRRVLQQLQKRMIKEHGVSMKTGVECEFFLFDAMEAPKLSDRLDTQDKPCYDSHALMRRSDLITELITYMEQLGWGPYQADHEDANGQFEINWNFADACVTADRHVFFKFMVRSLAEKHGFRASFMPKPFPDRTGNGCHTHISLHDSKSDENVFKQSAGFFAKQAFKTGEVYPLTDKGRHFMAGVLNRTKEVIAITNPTVNSYKRLHGVSTLSGATWAPSLISWGNNNRTVMIRIPDAPRLEVRLADMAANPYLLPAAFAAAGHLGMVEKPDIPFDPVMGNLFDPHYANSLTLPSLPIDLGEALNAFDAATDVRGVLGEEFSAAYSKLRRQHWNAYTLHMSQWELDKYLDS